MSVTEDIEKNIKKAMVAHDELTLSVLRMAKTAIHNKAIALKKKELTEEEVKKILLTEAKKHHDSIAAFEQGGRQELADKEKKELKVLEEYLPQQLDEEETKKIVQQVIEGLDDAQKNFGTAMKMCMAELKGQADGQLVSRLVKNALAPSAE
ncbi:MAG: GatB/YqeY domain-containing protein [Patescibacteria group bacterium]|jgi:hypothetical protein